MLDEAKKRKPIFDEDNSVRVTLADGQAWAVPKPWLEIRPVFRGGRAASNFPVYTYGAELEELVEAIGQAEGLCDQLSAVATLAARLLQWHYELSDADLDQLLAFRRGDPASAEWTERVIETATGRCGPKAGRAGGG